MVISIPYPYRLTFFGPVVALPVDILVYKSKNIYRNESVNAVSDTISHEPKKFSCHTLYAYPSLVG